MADMNEVSDLLTRFHGYLDMDARNVDFNRLAKDIQELLGAEQVVLHMSTGSSWFMIKGLTGDHTQIEIASRALGQNLLGKKWYLDQQQLDYLKMNTLAKVPDRHVSSNCLMPNAETQKMMALFKIRSVFVLPVYYRTEIKGLFTLISSDPDFLPDQNSAEQAMMLLGASFLRWEAEEKVRQQSSEIQLLLENMTDVVGKIDIEGIWTYISPSIQHMLGFSENDMVGKSVLDIVHPDHHAQIKRLMNQQESIKHRIKIEIRVRSKNASYIWIQAGIRGIRDQSDKYLGAAVSLREITQQKNVDMEKYDFLNFLKELAPLSAEPVPLEKDFLLQLAEAQRNQDEVRRKSEEFRALAENSPDIITRYDRNFVRVFINSAIEKEMGFPVKSLLGRSIYEGVMPQNVVQELEKKLQDCFATGHSQENSMGIMTPAGLKYFQARFVPEFSENGDVEYVLNVTRNVTNLVEAERKMRESEERFRMLAENALDVVFRMELNPEPHITYVSPSFLTVSGYSPEECYQKDIFWGLMADDSPDGSLKELVSATSRQHSFELPVRHRSGEKLWLEVVMTAILDNQGSVTALEGIARDITLRKQAEDEIRHLTYHDILTGVYNRSFYELELKRIDVERQLPLSMIIGDLNGLKLINDSLGHQEGDRILKATADILKQSCRQEDIICRWGGDEFAILLPQTNEKAADSVCRRILQAIHHVNKTMNVPISLSLGISTKNNIETPVETVMKEAEDRMYRRKLQDSRSVRSPIIHSLLQSLENRTKKTREHTDKMRRDSLALGTALKLNAYELDKLALLCAMHDIGKIAVPDSILLKKEKLSKEEKRIMQSHSEHGYRIAQSAPDLSHIAHEILSHHEWWDGSGYPQGLKGEDIPVLARILSVVDAFHVMTNGRPGQKKDLKEAAKELVVMSDTQFDAKIVKVYVEVVLGYQDLICKE